MGSGSSVDAAEAAKNATDEDIQKALDNMPEEKKAKAVAALASKKAGPKAEKKASGDQTVAIIYYSMYGHIEGMAQEIKKGLEKGGVSVDMFQVPETLPDDVLKMMGAPPKNPDVPTLDMEMVSKLHEHLGGVCGVFLFFSKFTFWPLQLCNGSRRFNVHCFPGHMAQRVGSVVHQVRWLHVRHSNPLWRDVCSDESLL